MTCSLMEKKTLQGKAIYIPASMGRTFELKIKIKSFFQSSFFTSIFYYTWKKILIFIFN